MKRPPKLSRRERRAARVPSSPTTYTDVPAALEPFAAIMAALEDALDVQIPPFSPALFVGRETTGGISLHSTPIDGGARALGDLLGADVAAAVIAADEVRRREGADGLLFAVAADGSAALLAFDMRRRSGQRINAPGGGGVLS